MDQARADCTRGSHGASYAAVLEQYRVRHMMLEDRSRGSCTGSFQGNVSVTKGSPASQLRELVVDGGIFSHCPPCRVS